MRFPFSRETKWLYFSLQVKLPVDCCKPIDRPAGRPPKRKSLHDITEGKGRRVVTPTPSNCLRTDKTRHGHIFRDKKVNGDFAKKGTVCTSFIKHAFYLCFTIERIAFMNFIAVRLSNCKSRLAKFRAYESLRHFVLKMSLPPA